MHCAIMAAKWHAAAIDIHLSSKRFAKSGNSHDTPREEDRTRSGSVLVYRRLLHFHSLLQNATVPKTIFAADRWAINADWCLGFLAGNRRWWLRARDRDMDCQRSNQRTCLSKISRSLLRHLHFVFVCRAPAIGITLLL